MSTTLKLNFTGFLSRGRLARKLSHEGWKTATNHGNRSQHQRTQALKGFQDGYYRVLVATDIAARGIHVEGISHVANYDLPQVAEGFIHRTASTLATRGERSDIAQIARLLAVRMVRRPIPGEVAREQKSTAPVVVIPSALPNGRRSFRTFAPRNRRPVRHAG